MRGLKLREVMFTSHDRLVQDGSPTRAAAVRALLTDWASIREQKQVAVAFHSALALCAPEATSWFKVDGTSIVSTMKTILMQSIDYAYASDYAYVTNVYFLSSFNVVLL